MARLSDSAAMARMAKHAKVYDVAAELAASLGRRNAGRRMKARAKDEINKLRHLAASVPSRGA